MRWFGSREAVARLTSEQVLRIAREHVRREGHDPAALNMVTRCTRESAVLWHVSEPGVGAVMVVEVDDARGAVNWMRRMPLR